MLDEIKMRHLRVFFVQNNNKHFHQKLLEWWYNMTNYNLFIIYLLHDQIKHLWPMCMNKTCKIYIYKYKKMHLCAFLRLAFVPGVKKRIKFKLVFCKEVFKLLKFYEKNCLSRFSTRNCLSQFSEEIFRPIYKSNF